MTQIVDQLADIILMEAVYGGDINAVDDEARDSEAYLHAQNAAQRILTQIATKSTKWGIAWDGRGLAEDAEPYNPAEDRHQAYYLAEEYWATPVYQNIYTLRDSVTNAPPEKNPVPASVEGRVIAAPVS